MTVSTTRGAECRAISERFITALEQVVWRYRALQPSTSDAYLHAEAVTAEVAHQLAIARGALFRHPGPGSG
jgi:hypothetical protein